METFRSFYSEEEAAEMRDLLLQHYIDTRVEKIRNVIDKVFIGEMVEPEFLLKMAPKDFSTADTILNNYISKNIAAIDKDHYLYSFTIAELEQIVRNPLEWSNQDVIIAQKLLNEKGQPITQEQIQHTKEIAIEEMAKPESRGWGLVVLGYLTAATISVVGLLIGLMIFQSSKLLPTGKRVRTFTRLTRDHAVAIIIVAIVRTVLYFLGIWKQSLFPNIDLLN